MQSSKTPEQPGNLSQAPAAAGANFDAPTYFAHLQRNASWYPVSIKSVYSTPSFLPSPHLPAHGVQ